MALGSALSTVLSVEAFGARAADAPGRLGANVVTGVGFLGGGMILKEGGTIRGLSTAAGIWETAAVGMAVAVNCWLGQQVLTGPPQRGHVLSTKTRSKRVS